jgi:hypothetical protein
MTFIVMKKPQSITQNTSPSGRTLTLVLLRLRRQRRGWLGYEKNIAD